MKIIQEKVVPVRKRELRAEILPGSLDWKEYYEQYGLNVQGIVPNPRGREGPEMNVNHCWRFIRRSVPRTSKQLRSLL